MQKIKEGLTYNPLSKNRGDLLVAYLWIGYNHLWNTNNTSGLLSITTESDVNLKGNLCWPNSFEHLKAVPTIKFHHNHKVNVLS